MNFMGKKSFFNLRQFQQEYTVKPTRLRSEDKGETARPSTYFLALPCPSMPTLQRSSTSVQSPSKSWGWGQELRLFLLPGDVWVSVSTSLNTTAVPPPAVGRHSPCKQIIHLVPIHRSMLP